MHHKYSLRSLALADRRQLLKRARTFNEDNMVRQYTAFPYPHMCYIRESANAKTQLKLRQTCKYFHKMNPKLIVKYLFCGKCSERYPRKYDLHVQNVEEMPVIDVITKEIFCIPYDKRIISKIHRCEAKEINFSGFRGCEISMEELRFFTHSGMVRKWNSLEAKISDVYGKDISLEALLFHLPKAEAVGANVKDVTSEDPFKIASGNNKIKVLYIQFQGPIKADECYELLKKVLAPKATIDIFIDGKTNKTYRATFKAEMKAKMETWKPRNEKPCLRF